MNDPITPGGDGELQATNLPRIVLPQPNSR